MKMILTLCCCALLYLFTGEAFGQKTPVWTFHGRVADGGQIDALSGPDDRVHLLSSSYYQFDLNGRRLVNENIGDAKQGGMDFPPALAVDPQGNTHIITRHGGSSANAGYDIRYRMRRAGGGWQDDFWIGSREKRNYVVGIAAPGVNDIYQHYTKAGSNVWGDIRIWKKNSASATSIGELADIWRADTDARMRGFAGRLFMVSGKCDGNGSAYFTFCNAGSTCFAELTNNIRSHSSGNGRTGAPDLYVDKQGNVHVTYGAEYEVYYNQYNKDQQLVFSQDKRIFTGLGGWHLNLGMSAIAASDDGTTIVAVALNPDGKTQGATNSELLWTYSTDGGSAWSTPDSLGVYTDGGEGRRRPRLVSVGNTFLLFYRNNTEGGISLATVDLVASAAVVAPTNLLLLK